MSVCRGCLVDKYTVIGISVILDQLSDEKFKINKEIAKYQIQYKSERLNNKQQDMLNPIYTQLDENLIIRDYLIKKKNLLLEKFIHPEGLNDETNCFSIYSEYLKNLTFASK